MDFTALSENDLALWLYGSRARGDADIYSDFDVLAISESDLSEDQIRGFLNPDASSISLSKYNWMELEGIAAYGSLFLLHIRLEGKCIYESPPASGRLGKVLDSLGPYGRVRQDLTAFRAGLRDVNCSLNQGGSTLFELSVLATILRHTAILGCYLAGCPTFGRFSPMDRLVDLGLLKEQVAYRFRDLYDYRLHAVRGTPQPERTCTEDAIWWVGQIEALLSVLEEKANGFKADMQ